MKKIKLLLLFISMIIATSGFSTLYSFCINGATYLVLTDGNGNVKNIATLGSCSPDGFMWKSEIKIYPNELTAGGGGDGEAAPTWVYSTLNNIDLVANATTLPPDTIRKYTAVSGTKYYLDPFLLNQNVAEAMAKAQGESIYGLKILGNPFAGHDVHYKVLSDVAQTVTVKVTGASFTFTTNVSMNRGLNDLVVNVPNSVSGPAYFKVGPSNSAKAVINFL